MGEAKDRGSREARKAAPKGELYKIATQSASFKSRNKIRRMDEVQRQVRVAVARGQAARRKKQALP